MLAYVYQLIPPGTPVLLVGDSGSGAVELLRQLETWHWSYVLRQTAKELVQRGRATDRQTCGLLVQHPGETAWCPRATFTVCHAYHTNLLAYWQVGEPAPGLLTTNLPSPSMTRQAYRRRMWIDEMFGDLKKHGVDLESTHLNQISRLSRLTLVVALLYVWLMSVGTHTIKQGQRHWVDRKERRDLSIFQIGWRMIERFLTNAFPIRIVSQPYLC